MDVLSALRAARLVPVVVLAGSRQSRVSAGQQQFDGSVWVAALTERFANPRMRHRLDQIAWDGSQKLPIRTLPTLRRELAAGRTPPGATRPVAAWVSHLRGHGAKITDARRAEILPLVGGPLPEAVRNVLDVLDPELAADAGVVAAVLAQAQELEAS